MDYKISEVAERIRALRDIEEIPAEKMAEICGVTTENYIALESGESDFSFTFLYKCADALGVDLVELLTGENPHLSSYTVVRQGKGLPIKRRAGFNYSHLAACFKNKLAEPFLVTAPYDSEAENKNIELSFHPGQEFNYIISGSLRFVIDGNEEILNAGDSVFYNSGKGHGMTAAGTDCVFLSLVLKPQNEDKGNKF